MDNRVGTRMISSTCTTVWLHCQTYDGSRVAFSTLVGLFDRVDLRTNVRMTAGIVCRPCQVAGTQLEDAYGRCMTGKGPSYRERQKELVQCRECEEEMSDVSLAGHMKARNGRAAEERCIWKTSATGEEPQMYRMSFLDKGGKRSCSVVRCSGRAATKISMWVHFMHPHVLENVVILYKGNLPHPQ